MTRRKNMTIDKKPLLFDRSASLSPSSNPRPVQNGVHEKDVGSVTQSAVEKSNGSINNNIQQKNVLFKNNTVNKYNNFSTNLSTEENFIFYGDISKFSPRNYIAGFYKKYYNNDLMNFDKIELDYAEKIVVNSQIAVNKYKLFTCSLILTLAGIITLAIFFILG